MAVYPANPNLPQGVDGTDVDPTNWNKFVDNINAIGADLVDGRGDGQTFPGTPHTSGQATDLDGILQAIKHMIADITGETNWYDQTATALKTVARTSITFGNDDVTPSVLTAGHPVGMCHTATGNTGALTVKDLDDGKDGQVIIILGANNTHKTTLKAQTVDPTSSLVLRSDWLEGVDIAIILIYDSVAGEWTEISRSPEEGGGGGEGDDIDITTSDATATDQTVNLPTAYGKLDDLYGVVKTDGTTNTVTINPDGSETIGGASKLILRRQYESAGFISDGSNWWLIGRTGPALDVRDFGAVGDGSTDDAAAIQACVDAAPDGSTIYFPYGKYYLSSAGITITKRLNLIGDGFGNQGGSQLFMAGNFDLIYYDGTGTAFGGCRIEKLVLGGSQTMKDGEKALLKMRVVRDTVINQIFLCGGYYGIRLMGCLGTTMYDIGNIGDTNHFGDCANQCNYFIFGERSDSKSINHTAILNCHIQQHGAYGIYITDTNNEGGLVIHGGLIEAMATRCVHLAGIHSYFDITGLHLEGTGGSSAYLSTCSNGSFRNCYITGTDGITLSSCSNMIIEGGYVTKVVADEYCNNIKITGIKMRTSGDIDAESGNTDVQNITKADGIWENASGKYTPSQGSGNNLADGLLEAWADGLPIGFTYRAVAAEVAQESTIVKFGTYSAKVEVPAGGTVAGLRFYLDYDRVGIPHMKNRNSSDYKWTLSGSGTAEYYCELAAGGDPGIKSEPRAVRLNGAPVSKETLGALTAAHWGYGDNDSLGYSTIYVRLVDDTDPDTKATGYVESQWKMCTITARAWAYKPETNGVNPTIRIRGADGSETGSQIFSIPTDEWTPITATFNIGPGGTGASVIFYTKYTGGTPGELCYFDGIEIVEGYLPSPIYDDTRGTDGDFRVGGTLLESGEVGTMTGNETFAFGDGNIFIKDPGGAARNFDPTGNFPALVKITVINTADAAEAITFDSGVLAEAIAQNERGIFIYDGTIWRKVYVGS